MTFIAYLKATTIGIAKITGNHLKMSDHYGLIKIQQKKIYVNVLTTKPFGKSYEISNSCVEPYLQKTQYILDQTFIIDTRLMEIIRMSKANEYFMIHQQKFQSIISQIDLTKAIDLTQYIT